MSQVHAPYNFVPLNEVVVTPEWAPLISQDVPFSDGICGEIEIDLEATTAICVGGGREGDRVTPFRTPDGRYAIPGSSVKGMLRNVLEIITFSKFQFVDRSRRYAVRDLQNRQLYISRMTKTVGNEVYEPRAEPGWLQERNGDWFIQPCEVSRVEQADLLGYLGEDAAALRRCFINRSSLQDKYGAWAQSGQPLEIQFCPGAVIDHRMSNGRGHLRFSLADLRAGDVDGTLVFTGQPSPNARLLPGGENKGKHREFVFYGSKGAAVAIDDRVRHDFELNHSLEQGERHGGEARPNDEWGFWRARLEGGDRVPIFFLRSERDPRVIDCIGLTQMFRLAYRHTLGDAIDNSCLLHNPDPATGSPEAGSPVMDLADAIFGYSRSHAAGAMSARGRVHIGLFTAAEGQYQLRDSGAILNGPKPTFYPAYIEQSDRLDPQAGGENPKVRKDRGYATLMDENVRLRGWKRYPVRPSNESPVQGNASVATQWRALPAGTRFRGRIRVHNLREVEFGALAWALDFGGREACCHALGLAKPFGFGAVKLHEQGCRLVRLADGKSISLQDARKGFEAYMENRVPGWAESEQLVQLLGMADPSNAVADRLTYMVLQHKEFTEAKRDLAVLPRYITRMPGRRIRAAGAPSRPGGPLVSRPVSGVGTGPQARGGSPPPPPPPPPPQDPLDIVRGILGAVLDRPVAEQANYLLRNCREVPPSMASRPKEWASAVLALFPEPVKLLETRAAKSGGSEVTAAEAELAGHEARKPQESDSKALKKWARDRDALLRRVAQKRQGRSVGSTGAQERRPISWHG